MARDVLLAPLQESVVVTADGNSDYIECEGGNGAWVHISYGAMAGASTTLDVRVMVSPDGGTTYYMKGKFQQVGPTDDNKEDTIMVYLPQPETPGQKLQYRLNYDVAGASPSYTINWCHIDAQVVMAPPAGAEHAEVGAASQISGL